MPPKPRSLKGRNVIATIVIDDSSPEPPDSLLPLSGPLRPPATLKTIPDAKGKGKGKMPMKSQVIEITSSSEDDDNELVPEMGTRSMRRTASVARQATAGPSTSKDKGKARQAAFLSSKEHATPSSSQKREESDRDEEVTLFLPASDEDNDRLSPQARMRQQAPNASAGPSTSKGAFGSTTKRCYTNDDEEPIAGPSHFPKRPRLSQPERAISISSQEPLDSPGPPRLSLPERAISLSSDDPFDAMSEHEHPSRNVRPRISSPRRRQRGQNRQDARMPRKVSAVLDRDQDVADDEAMAKRLQQEEEEAVRERRARERARRIEVGLEGEKGRRNERAKERARLERERRRDEAVRDFGEAALAWDDERRGGDAWGGQEMLDIPARVPAGDDELDPRVFNGGEDVDMNDPHPPLSPKFDNNQSRNPNLVLPNSQPRPLQPEASLTDLSIPTASILEVIPDVDPDHVAALVAQHVPTYGKEGVVGYVMNHLFENGNYPKVDKKKGMAHGAGSQSRASGSGSASQDKGKGKEGGAKKKQKGRAKELKRLTPDEAVQAIIDSYSASPESPFKHDYDEGAPKSRAYIDLALQFLSATEFPYIPKPVVQRCLTDRLAGGQPFLRTWIYLSIVDGRITGEVGNGRVQQRVISPPRSGDGQEVEAPLYVRKSNPTPASTGKGKKKAPQDDRFEAEWEWMEERREEVWRRIRRIERAGRLEGADEGSDSGYLSGGASTDDEDAASQEPNNGDPPWLKDNEDSEPFDESSPDLIECGCCFGSWPIERMVQCPEGHLFCRFCLWMQCKTLLGERRVEMSCMHSYGPGEGPSTEASGSGGSGDAEGAGSGGGAKGLSGGCERRFDDSTLKGVIGSKLYRLYERIKQQKELEEAKIEGLEECPFCDFAAVVEDPIEVDKLFRCGNEECAAVSCRECKRVEHTPKSCKEMDEDKHLDTRLSIEEAMTKALMRNCPKCGKSFIKESGCNKMTCPNCRQLSCYVCKQKITGYDHFHQNNPGQPGGSSTTNKCPLWDSVDARHSDEVKKAYEDAVAQVKKSNPDVEMGKDIKVDLPPAPPPGALHGLPAGYIDPAMLMGGGGGGWFHYGPPPLPAYLDAHPYRQRLARRQEALAQAQRGQAAEANRLPDARARESMARGRLENLRAGLSAFGPDGRPPNAEERQLRAQQLTNAQTVLRNAAIERAAIETRLHTHAAQERELTRLVQQDVAQLADIERRANEWRAGNRGGGGGGPQVGVIPPPLPGPRVQHRHNQHQPYAPPRPLNPLHRVHEAEGELLVVQERRRQEEMDALRARLQQQQDMLVRARVMAPVPRAGAGAKRKRG